MSYFAPQPPPAYPQTGMSEVFKLLVEEVMKRFAEYKIPMDMLQIVRPMVFQECAAEDRLISTQYPNEVSLTIIQDRATQIAMRLLTKLNTGTINTGGYPPVYPPMNSPYQQPPRYPMGNPYQNPYQQHTSPYQQVPPNPYHQIPSSPFQQVPGTPPGYGMVPNSQPPAEIFKGPQSTTPPSNPTVPKTVINTNKSIKSLRGGKSMIEPIRLVNKKKNTKADAAVYSDFDISYHQVYELDNKETLISSKCNNRGFFSDGVWCFRDYMKHKPQHTTKYFVDLVTYSTDYVIDMPTDVFMKEFMKVGEALANEENDLKAVVELFLTSDSKFVSALSDIIISKVNYNLQRSAINLSDPSKFLLIGEITDIRDLLMLDATDLTDYNLENIGDVLFYAFGDVFAKYNVITSLEEFFNATIDTVVKSPRGIFNIPVVSDFFIEKPTPEMETKFAEFKAAKTLFQLFSCIIVTNVGFDNPQMIEEMKNSEIYGEYSIGALNNKKQWADEDGFGMIIADIVSTICPTDVYFIKDDDINHFAKASFLGNGTVGLIS